MIFWREQLEKEISKRLLAGEEIHARLRNISESLPPTSKHWIFYYKSRVKGFESLWDKLTRRAYINNKTQKKTDRNQIKRYQTLDNITDFIGFRFVCMADRDLLHLVDIVISVIQIGQIRPNRIFNGESPWDCIIEANFSVRMDGETALERDPYFQCYQHMLSRLILFELSKKKKDKKLRGELDEIKNNSGGPQSHARLQKLAEAHLSKAQKYKNNRSKLKDPAFRESGYTSVHIICDAHNSSGVRVPVEFQIRTAVEDIWGETNHDSLYKVRHPYIWTEDIEDIYKDLEKRSGSLNGIMKLVPSSIAEISDKVEQAREKFLLFKQPDRYLNFSIVVMYIQIVVAERYNNNRGLLDDYQTKYLTIFEKGEPAERNEIVDTCVNIIEAFKNTTKDMAFKDDRSSRLVDRLCDFELLRLRAVNLDVGRGGSDPISLIPFDQNKYDKDAEVARAIFYDWKALEQSPDWILIPRTVFKFFDYFLLDFFDPSRAIIALEEAWSSTVTDDTLPPWSIYRIVIPSALSAYYERTGSSILEDIRRSMPEPSDVLYAEIGQQFIRAMHFAKEAVRQGADRNNNSRRGDVIFWRFGRSGYGLDINNISTIYLLTHDYFEGHWATLCSVSRSDVDSLVEFARASSNLRPGLLDELLKLWEAIG